jgi:hypothetical protein
MQFIRLIICPYMKDKFLCTTRNSKLRWLWFPTHLTTEQKLQLILWSWALLERPPVVKPLDSIPAFYWTRKFITTFRRALHLFLSWARLIQSTSPHPISILSTQLCLSLPSYLFPSDFPTNYLYVFLFVPHSCYMPCPSHPPRLHRSNYTWRRVQVTELLVMQFPPPSSAPSVYVPPLMSMLGGSFVTITWHVLRLWMEGSCKYTE